MGENKIRILIIENSLDITGAFKSIFSLALSIVDEFEFFFAIRSSSKLTFHLAKGGVKYLELPFLEVSKQWRVMFYLPVLFINTWRVVRYTKRNRINIVHVNDLYNMIGVVLKLMNPKIKII